MISDDIYLVFVCDSEDGRCTPSFQEATQDKVYLKTVIDPLRDNPYVDYRVDRLSKDGQNLEDVTGSV